MLACAQGRGRAQQVGRRVRCYGAQETYDPLSEALHDGRRAVADTARAAERMRRRSVLIGAGPSRRVEQLALRSPDEPMQGRETRTRSMRLGTGSVELRPAWRATRAAAADGR